MKFFRYIEFIIFSWLISRFVIFSWLQIDSENPIKASPKNLSRIEMTGNEKKARKRALRLNIKLKLNEKCKKVTREGENVESTENENKITHI